MPLTRAKKEQVVSSVKQLLEQSKLTVIAKYQGASVKDMQNLRATAKDSGTTVKVIKNRLVIQSLKGNDKLSSINTDQLQGMLVYAFNSEDEVAPAQSIAEFAKSKPEVEFVGAITGDGNWLEASSVKELAELPSKPVLIASVVALLESPIRSVVGATGGNLPNLIASLKAKASS